MYTVNKQKVKSVNIHVIVVSYVPIAFIRWWLPGYWAHDEYEWLSSPKLWTLHSTVSLHCKVCTYTYVRVHVHVHCTGWHVIFAMDVKYTCTVYITTREYNVDVRDFCWVWEDDVLSPLLWFTCMYIVSCAHFTYSMCHGTEDSQKVE